MIASLLVRIGCWIPVRVRQRQDCGLISRSDWNDSCAALGLGSSPDNALREAYQGGAFVSEHGSWDRAPLSGYAVVFVGFRQGKQVGQRKVVVSGICSGDDKKLYGVPVGLARDRKGALRIADDVGDAVWRVTAHAQ
ncbi:hypothetical protein KTQ42_03590|uniref:hypothetical protein n=1 Tax=Noviherbaspirillum sp. L7-7A TaxID=2850560 RepID=UPI001C2C0A39|nr:hypothetical protein [Noviherbaspirillum sp. L7-7A]MBV0878383.1 hypothetical protein [Noviherbaspirillum sp. L7-7A]